jgi:S1-C subfamily serine protease
MKALISVAFATFSLIAAAQQVPSTLDAKAIFEHTKAATVVVLAGEGAGRLNSIATGVIIAKDGVILTALHAVKGAAEVQVRTASGEVFDRVEMMGVDERRDVVALRISSGALPVLVPGSTAGLVQGPSTQ